MGKLIKRLKQDNLQRNWMGFATLEYGNKRWRGRNRIKKAKGTFALLRPLWRSKISSNTKLRIFKTNVKSVLLYGCET
jgi:hypothetical protein